MNFLIKPGTAGNFMIRNQNWKYIRYADGDQYLYDLINDPGEMTNLAGDFMYKALQKNLSNEMNAWLKCTGWKG